MRAKRVLITLAVGMFVVGPPITYSGAIVRFGVGLTSSYDLTMYAWLTLMIGVIIGCIAAVACMALRYRATLTAVATVTVVGLLIGGLYVLMFLTVGGPQRPFLLWASLVVPSALVGYLTAIVASGWLRMHPFEAANNAPTGTRDRAERPYRL